MNIIIVDDEDMIRDIFEKMLTRLGHDVIAYRNYEGLPCEDADLYFLDHDIKNGMSGYQFLQVHGKHIPPYKRVMMSGACSWQEHGLDGHYLAKPFAMAELKTLLTEVEK